VAGFDSTTTAGYDSTADTFSIQNSMKSRFFTPSLSNYDHAVKLLSL